MKPNDNKSPGLRTSSENPSDSQNVDFETLIEAVKSGDERAVQSLLESCRDYLLLIANQELDRDLHAKLGPSDIVQNTLVAVHQHVAEFKGTKQEQFLAWVRQILLNDLNRARRELKGTAKRNTRLEWPLQGDSRIGQLPIEFSDQDFTPQTNAVRNEENANVERAMQRLNEEQREVIMFRNFHQLPFREIARKMNRSEDGTQKLWTRAIEKLKQELRDINAL